MPGQRNARGDAAGAQGGDDAGDERDYRQGGGDAANDQRVGGADDEKLVGEELSKLRRAAEYRKFKRAFRPVCAVARGVRKRTAREGGAGETCGDFNIVASRPAALLWGSAMSLIVSGSFADVGAVNEALTHLAEAGFPPSVTRQTRLNSSAETIEEAERIDDVQKDIADAKAAAPGAASGAASGAAVGVAVGVAVGLVAFPFLGPIAPLAAAGVGAYAGSLGGALANMSDDDSSKVSRSEASLRVPSDGLVMPIVLTVVASTAGEQDVVCDILRSHGATSITKGAGTLGKSVQGP